MLGLILLMEDIHEHSNEVKLCKELVNCHTHRLELVHSVIVLDQLVMGTSHPREAELVAKGWVNQHGEDLDNHFMNGCDLA